MTLLKLTMILAMLPSFAGAAVADECLSKATEAAARIGGTIESHMVIGVFVSHPHFKILGVLCQDHKAVGVVMEATPNNASSRDSELFGQFVEAVLPAISAREASLEALKCESVARWRKIGRWP